MPVPNQAWIDFLSLPARLGWPRVKAHRAEPLQPGGRCLLTLFESVDGGRPHPRLRVSLPAATDPRPPAPWLAERAPPSDDAAFLTVVEELLEEHAEVLAADDLTDDELATGSPRYTRASVRGQRQAAFFTEAEQWLDVHGRRWTPAQRQRARYALGALRDVALEGPHPFDDADTGTYHSFGEDAPFVHCLQQVLDTVPEPGSDAFALLPPEQQAAVRAQRSQCQAHLDHLMRHKYAFHGVDERDIERSIGARLVHRVHRAVLTSEVPEDSLTPVLSLLRIEPDADHAHPGAWVYRDGAALRLQDGREVEVADESLRHIRVDASEATFHRHPDGPLLRREVPFDWNGDGLLADQRISWVDWAGHCDLKAIQEALGLTLTAPRPAVREYRSDTGRTHTVGRDGLLEVLTALMECGSRYQTFDGSRDVVRGVTRFGGARNDSLPDRIQLQGLRAGRSFRWPLTRDQADFRVVRLGDETDVDGAFERFLADGEALTLEPNPRFLKTIEGDYNLIDVSGQRLEASVIEHGFDPASGAYQRSAGRVVLDLARTEGRTLLGTHLQDASQRELYRVWLDHERPAVVAELERWERSGSGWAPVAVTERNVVLPMVTPLTATLSREARSDDPAAFQALLDAALRRGEGIVADTDDTAPVWNGVVTHLDVAREAADPARRVERWRVELVARFGKARLRWLLQRDEHGRPEHFAALPATGQLRAPDFLWQDFPDVASKGRERGTWVVNRTMVERGVVTLRPDPTVAGGTYVHDEHVKNLAEVLWCGLSGAGFTVVHANKRYVFTDEATWRDAIAAIEQARRSLQSSPVA